jgi:hypothetical protein
VGNIVTVFRCGSMAKPVHNERMESSFKFFDSIAPEGRVLRRDAIFASPERTALQPWIDMKERKRNRSETMQRANREFNHEFNMDVSVRHLDLFLDDSLFVYNADLFGEIHITGIYNDWDPQQVDASLYWESGIPLSEWKNSEFANTKEAESWEVLVSSRHIQTITMEKDLRLVA